MMDDEDMENGFDEEAEGPPEEPQDTTDLVTVAQARNMKEARAMKSILESAEITAFIGQEDATLGADEVGPGIPVLVPEEMAIEAEEILAEAAMSDGDPDEDQDLDDWDLEDDEDEDDEYYEDDLEDLDDEDEDYLDDEDDDDFDDVDDEDD